MPLIVRACGGEEFVRVVHAAGATVPVEQSPAWAGYVDALAGREHWRYLIAWDGNVPVAALSLSVRSGRFLQQVWAKNGPIWLGDGPSRTPQAERELREVLIRYVRAERPRAALLRLHAVHAAPDLTEPLIGTCCDRTVVLDLTLSEEELLAGASQGGRRHIRKASRDPDLVFADETGMSRHEFAKTLYPVFVQAGERGGFALHHCGFYYEMLRRLGPGVCRLFTVRHRGAVTSWMIGTIYDGRVNYYYAASSAQGRRLHSAYLMVWSSVQWAKEHGATSYDLLGCGSPRAPSLAGLNQFKTAFARDGIVDIPGPWDVVLRPPVMRAYRAQRRVVTGLSATARRMRAAAFRSP